MARAKGKSARRVEDPKALRARLTELLEQAAVVADRLGDTNRARALRILADPTVVEMGNDVATVGDPGQERTFVTAEQQERIILETAEKAIGQGIGPGLFAMLIHRLATQPPLEALRSDEAQRELVLIAKALPVDGSGYIAEMGRSNVTDVLTKMLRAAGITVKRRRVPFAESSGRSRA